MDNHSPTSKTSRQRSFEELKMNSDVKGRFTGVYKRVLGT